MTDPRVRFRLARALPFYLARGWREVERGRHATLAGVELECVLMEKGLDDPDP